MTTLTLIPGLISDGIVWQPVADSVGSRMDIHVANLTSQSSITEMAQSVLDAVTGPMVAVGHSMGGRVALEMAHLSPDRVVGLVLANTGHHPKRDTELPKREEMIALGHKSMDALTDAWLPPMVHPDRVQDDRLMSGLRAMVARADADIHELQIRALISRPDAGAYMSKITCPTLVLAASHDQWAPVEQHRQIEAAMPNASLTIIEDAGHFAPVERPETVSAAITEWLDTNKGAFNG